LYRHIIKNGKNSLGIAHFEMDKSNTLRAFLKAVLENSCLGLYLNRDFLAQSRYFPVMFVFFPNPTEIIFVWFLLQAVIDTGILLHTIMVKVMTQAVRISVHLFTKKIFDPLWNFCCPNNTSKLSISN